MSFFKLLDKIISLYKVYLGLSYFQNWVSKIWEYYFLKFWLKNGYKWNFFFYFCFKIHHVYHNKRSVYLVVLSKRRKGSWSYDILSNFLIYGLVSQESVCLWRSIYLEIYIHINTPDTIEHVLVFSNTSTTFRQTGRFWLWRTFF